MGHVKHLLSITNRVLVYLMGLHRTLVFEKVARRDITGALDKLGHCGEVLERYPGLCRFTMG